VLNTYTASVFISLAPELDYVMIENQVSYLSFWVLQAVHL